MSALSDQSWAFACALAFVLCGIAAMVGFPEYVLQLAEALLDPLQGFIREGRNAGLEQGCEGAVSLRPGKPEQLGDDLLIAKSLGGGRGSVHRYLRVEFME